MADYDIKLKQDDLVELLSKDQGIAALLTSVLNQVLESQMTEHLNVEPYEQSEQRQGYRNGFRTRQLYTRVGKITLRVPQTRDGSFNSKIFKRYQRSEQALVSTLMEMYLQGVSTRKVKKVTEELCGTQFSKSTVSQLTVGLDVRIHAWKHRRLEKPFPFVIVDAMVSDVRRDHAVRSTGILIVYGVNKDGIREVLGLWLADSESEQSWEEAFKDLKERGLSGVDLVVSDNHTGLVNAIKKQFQGAQWQRCQTHFIRNILGKTPRHCRKAVAAHLKLVFTAPDKTTAHKLANDLIEQFCSSAQKAMDCLERGLDDALTVLNFPEPYRQRLRTSNLAERVNEEIRRREIIIRVFPNEAAAMRLIGAILAEIHDEWQEGIRYFDMTLYWEHKQEMALKQKENNKHDIVSILTN